MQHIVDRFILLGNKAKVLLKVKNDLEPRVNILVNSKGEVSYTFNSTCFPFFSEDGFETVSGSGVDLFLDKCELYVKTLEKNIKLEFEKENKTEQTLLGNRFGKGYDYRKNWSSYLLETRTFKRRINVAVSDAVLENILTGKTGWPDSWKKLKITVEEFEK